MSKIFLYTYNVGNNRPPSDYSSFRIFKEARNKKADIYVVALQEIPHMEITKMETSSRTWRSFFCEMMSSCDLTLIYGIPLVSNLLLVFSEVRLASFIRQKNTRYVRYTMGGTLGYKGSLGIRLHLRSGVHLIFVISHLVHGDNNVEYRCQQLKQAASCMFDDICESEKRVIFWLGDLNFRVDNDSTSQCIIPSNVPSDLHSNIAEQLKTLMTQERVFQGFHEPEITFPPTYRFIVRQDLYDHARRPSWCDRILVKATDMKFNNIEYDSDIGVRYSDHRPVFAIYELDNLLAENNSNSMLCCFQEIPAWHSSVYFMAKFSFVEDYYNLYGSNFDWIGFFKFPVKSMEETQYWIYMATAYKVESFQCQHNHSDTYIAECSSLLPGEYVVAYFSLKFQTFIGMSNKFTVSSISL
ncbi:hypothetical protein FO519_003554 [Halicephalobus sp. NKZ332]|nr:hypothetical protein FO519_003554 [Halicephalobus sp. NKZ332]